MRDWIYRGLMVLLLFVTIVGTVAVGGLALSDQIAADHALCVPDFSRC